MKKSYFFKFLLIAIPASAFVLMSNSAGIDLGRSGSPGDSGNTCTTCHAAGASFSTSAAITSNIPVTGYLLDTDYTININTTSTSTKLGFQLAAESDTDTKIGSFTAGSGSRVTGDRITQSSPSTSGDWSFTWKSPATDLGRVTFYTAVNATNGNGGTSGDEVITASTSSASLSISNAARLDFELFPNPASSNITVQLPTGSNNATVTFYDNIGRLSLTQKISAANKQVNVSSLSRGVYILKVVSEAKIGTQKFLKN